MMYTSHSLLYVYSNCHYIHVVDLLYYAIVVNVKGADMMKLVESNKPQRYIALRGLFCINLFE